MRVQTPRKGSATSVVARLAAGLATTLQDCRYASRRVVELQVRPASRTR